MDRVLESARRVGVLLAAGALAGLLVGGVGGRLAMGLLFRLNTSTDGLTSDDGFEIGRFTLQGTLNLLLVGTLLGVVGAVIYALLRHLMIGPRWFQLVSIGLGPAIVVGDMLVHTDGVDFLVLDPLWLAVALFVLIPGLYAVTLSLLAERWLGPPPPGMGDGRAAVVAGWLGRAALTVLAFNSLVSLVDKVRELA